MRIKRVVSKTGKIYEYDASKYVYKHKSTKGLTLVGKNGRIYQKNIEKTKAAIDANDKYSDAVKTSLKASLDELVDVKHLRKEKLTTSGFYSKKTGEDKIDKLFLNLGYNVEDVAKIYDIDKDELKDESNWDGDILTIGSRKFILNFTYNQDILVEQL